MKEISLTFEGLGRVSQSQVTQIIEASISGANNALSNEIIDTRERYAKAARYISQNGTYPRPPVLVVMDSKYEIVDGNHRVSAFFYCAGLLPKVSPPSKDVLQKTKTSQKMWIGVPNIK
jgi:hypothetical protein